MQLKLITTITLLSLGGFLAPVIAQDAPTARLARSSIQAQVSRDQVLEACSQDRADTLPIPFSDISPNDWAFKAVMSLYYCGAYRGSIPPEQAKPLLEQQATQPDSH